MSPGELWLQTLLAQILFRAIGKLLHLCHATSFVESRVSTILFSESCHLLVYNLELIKNVIINSLTPIMGAHWLRYLTHP